MPLFYPLFIPIIQRSCGTFLATAFSRMLTVKERYWRYSLFALIAGLGVAILVELAPFFGGLLGAATLYVLLRRQMQFLTLRHRWRRPVAAAVLVAEAILLFLIPLGLLVWMVTAKLQHIALDPQLLIDHLKHVAEVIESRTGYDFLNERDTDSLIAEIPRIGRVVVKGIIDLGVNLIVLIFVLYFMLIGGLRMEQYCREMLPFDRPTSRRVVRSVHLIVRSNAIAIPLLAVAQGVGAYVGYLLFGIQGAWFWAVITGCATILPIVGTALVWVPLGVFLAFENHWGAAIGLELYGVLVITQIDNLGRFIMQKMMADTHPLITIFGVFIGLSLFGFIGVIFGPLMLAMFAFCVGLFKSEYLDEKTIRDPVHPDDDL